MSTTQYTKYTPEPKQVSNSPLTKTPLNPPELSPIEAELGELKAGAEALEKSICILLEKIRPVCTIQEETQTDGCSEEPSSGCYIRDRLSERKRHIRYLGRIVQAQIETIQC